MTRVRTVVVLVVVMAAAVALLGDAKARRPSECPDVTDLSAPIRVRFDRGGNATVCPRVRLLVSLEQPLGTRINEVRRGERFRVVVGSPNLPEGRRLRYALCVNKTRGEQCYTRKPWSFSGGFADVIVWRVAEHEGRDGILTTPL